MTEGSFEDVNSLVLVPAQVMTRDDSSGGWVPMGGGGLSKVSVRKRMVPSEEDTKHEYLIFGKRISDQMVVLSCKIKKDFQYNKVMPTFHHWKTGNKKFGLTFQTAADARAFDKGVRRAVEDLLEGSVESTQIHDPDVGDDDVFMAVDLPVEQGDSQSSSGSSSVGGGTNGGGRPMPGSYLGVSTVGDHPSSSPYTHPHANQHYLHRVHYLPKATTPRMGPGGAPSTNNNGSGGSAFIIQEQLRKEQQQHDVEEAWARLSQQQPTHKMDGSRESKLRDSDKIEIASDSYPYVHFAPERPSLHEYSYPNVDAVKSGGDVRHQVAASKKLKGDNVVVVSQPPPLPLPKSKWKRDQKRGKLKHLLINRVSCKYCQESFCEEDNERGSCEYAPDRVRSCINTVTCLSCAQCMLYHCMSDAEGDFAHHPCTCDRSDENCSRRWLGLAVLSLFVPCLWCYLPLSTCHRCSVRYGMCGGRHKAS